MDLDNKKTADNLIEIDHVWHKVDVSLDVNGYEILIGPGLLTDLGTFLNEHPLSDHYVMVTDSNVKEFLADDLLSILEQAGIKVDLISFPAGEASKNMETIVSLAREMVRLGADRKSAVLAVGGGVVGDMAGFLASIYMRGIPFIQIPTTLLAQVDSSVGGKTGVDLPEGKNLLGTFYQPKRVFIDIGVLATLTQKEIRNGLAEVVKYGVIRSPELFGILEDRWWDVLNLEPEVTADIVYRSCSIKADVVAADEREGNLRRILNFGHTIGHAIEAAANYQIPHGEAISMGMVAVGRISVQKGLMTSDELERLISLLEKLGLPVAIPRELSPEKLLGLLRHDKKSVSGKVHFVLCTGIGSTKITSDVDDSEILAAIEASQG